MARFQNTFDNGTTGATVTVANSAASGDAFAAQFGSGVATYEASAAIQGASGMRVAAASSAIGFECSLGGATDTAGFSVEFTTPVSTASDLHLARIVSSDGTRQVGVHIHGGTDRLRFSDSSGTTLGVWTSTDALVANTKYRMELFVKAGTTTSNGEMRGAYFLAGSTTVIGSFALTNLNTNTGSPYTTFRFGRLTGATAQLTFDSPVWESNGTGLPGPLATALPTPVVTVTAQNGPTTIGGTNGSITITWPAVAGANHYEASVMPGTVTDGFTVADAAATSPKTFSGLGAGTYTVAVRAKATA